MGVDALYPIDALRRERARPHNVRVTSVLLAAIVLIAALGPTRRAVRIDPMTALRDE